MSTSGLLADILALIGLTQITGANSVALPADRPALLRAITSVPVGQAIPVTLACDETEQSLDIQEWPRRRWDGLDMSASMLHHQNPPDLGIGLASLDNANRARFGLNLKPDRRSGELGSGQHRRRRSRARTEKHYSARARNDNFYTTESRGGAREDPHQQPAVGLGADGTKDSRQSWTQVGHAAGGL
jgi:hypothetical protein